MMINQSKQAKAVGRACKNAAETISKPVYAILAAKATQYSRRALKTPQTARKHPPIYKNFCRATQLPPRLEVV